MQGIGASAKNTIAGQYIKRRRGNRVGWAVGQLATEYSSGVKKAPENEVRSEEDDCKQAEAKAGSIFVSRHSAA